MNTNVRVVLACLCCLVLWVGDGCKRGEAKGLENQPGATGVVEGAEPRGRVEETRSDGLVTPKVLRSVIPAALFGSPVAEREEGTSEGMSEEQCSTVSIATYKIRVLGEYVGPEWKIFVYDCASRKGLSNCCGARLNLDPSEDPREGGEYSRYGEIQIGGRSYTGEQHYWYAPASRTKWHCELEFYVAHRFAVLVDGMRILSDQCPEVAAKIDLQALERLAAK